MIPFPFTKDNKTYSEPQDSHSISFAEGLTRRNSCRLFKIWNVFKWKLIYSGNRGKKYRNVTCVKVVDSHMYVWSTTNNSCHIAVVNIWGFQVLK